MIAGIGLVVICICSIIGICIMANTKGSFRWVVIALMLVSLAISISHIALLLNRYALVGG